MSIDRPGQLALFVNLYRLELSYRIHILHADYYQERFRKRSNLQSSSENPCFHLKHADFTFLQQIFVCYN